ncbi:hypothetical protein [Nocardia sp. NPDC051750]|uniref:hypothetical protein n=1 Tax=Nocardia sp. NPDC051750 TaxID=3364325 RepID=UPI0037BB8332
MRANLAVLVAGAGLYLLFSVSTRYVQTPVGASYGFALPGVAAGAALIPFSLLGFVAGKAVPRLIARITERWTYTLSVVIAIAAALVFAAANQSLLAVLSAVALLAAATPTGAMLPTQNGYITAALWAVLPLAVSALVIATNRSARSASASPTS